MLVWRWNGQKWIFLKIKWSFSNYSSRNISEVSKFYFGFSGDDGACWIAVCVFLSQKKWVAPFFWRSLYVVGYKKEKTDTKIKYEFSATSMYSIWLISGTNLFREIRNYRCLKPLLTSMPMSLSIQLVVLLIRPKLFTWVLTNHVYNLTITVLCL